MFDDDTAQFGDIFRGHMLEGMIVFAGGATMSHHEPWDDFSFDRAAQHRAINLLNAGGWFRRTGS
jgi:hypothetical protein